LYEIKNEAVRIFGNNGRIAYSAIDYIGLAEAIQLNGKPGS